MKRCVATALIAIVAAACSSNSNAKSTSTTSPTSAAGTSDEQLAKQVVLQKSDVPSDWSSTPTNNNTSDTTDSRLTQCLGLPPGPLIKNATRADSDSFTTPTRQQASAS